MILSNGEARRERNKIAKRENIKKAWEITRTILPHVHRGELAQKTGICYREIERYFSGERSPSLVAFVAMARAINMPMEELAEILLIQQARRRQWTALLIEIKAEAAFGKDEKKLILKVAKKQKGYISTKDVAIMLKAAGITTHRKSCGNRVSGMATGPKQIIEKTGLFTHVGKGVYRLTNLPDSPE